MSKRIKCPHCVTEFELTEDLYGRRFACPVCGVPFAVSATGDVVVEAKKPAAPQAKPAAPRKSAAPNLNAGDLPKSHTGCFIFVLLLLLLAGGGAYWWFYMRPQPQVVAPEEVEAPQEVQPSADDALRKALEETAVEQPAVSPEHTVAGVEGSREVIKSKSVWTPKRRETLMALAPFDLQKSECAQKRQEVLNGPSGAHFTATDAVSPIRQNVELIRAYTKDDFKDAELAVRLANVRTHIFAAVGVDALRSMVAREGGVEFLQTFFNDLDWMEEFASGCPPYNITERRAFRRLDMLVWNDNSNWILATKVGRRLATALALNAADSKREPIISRFKTYERLYRAGRLPAEVENYSVRDWREALSNKLRGQDLDWLNSRANVPEAELLALTNNVKKANFNCFGLRKRDPLCQGLWSLMWPEAQILEFTGGSSDDRLSYVAQLIQAQARPAGLVNKNTLLVRSAKGDWRVVGQTKTERLDWQEEGLLGKELSQILASSVVLADEEAFLASERVRWLAATRARQFRAQGWTERVDATYRAALKAYPLNVLAWRDYRDWLEKNKVSAKVWQNFGRLAAKSLAPVPPFAYEMLNAWFAQLKKTGATLQVRLAALKAAHALLREPEEPWTEYCDFGGFLQASAELLENDPASLLDLFDTITTAQLGASNFFNDSIVWAAKVFMKDKRTAAKFLASAKTWADPKTYTSYSAQHRSRMKKAGWQPKVPELNWNEILYAASENNNREGFLAALELARKYAKPAATKEVSKKGAPVRDKKLDKTPPMLFGARIVSEGAMPSALPLMYDAEMNPAITWDKFCDITAAGETRVCASWTNEPSITITLPFAVEAAGILIKNVEKDVRATTQESPLVVEVSKDGKTWHEIWQEKVKLPEIPTEGKLKRLEEPDEWRIDLTAQKPRVVARYIRAKRGVESGVSPFALAKIVVYGKKARASAR